MSVYGHCKIVLTVLDKIVNQGGLFDWELSVISKASSELSPKQLVLRLWDG